MATISPTKWGYVVGPSSTSFTTARDGSTGTSVVTNPTTAQGAAIRYQYYGRGTLYHQISRAFFSFDTSAYTNATTAKLNLYGSSFNTAAPLILVDASTAFGSGNSDLTTSDFGNLTFSKQYSASTISWSTSTVNTISINSGGVTAINSLSYFRVALIQYSNDHQNAAAISSTLQNAGINYGSAMQLILTVPSNDGPTRVEKIGRYEKSKISRFDGYALSKIASINGVN